MYDINKSREIYSILNAGKIINRNTLNNAGELMDNALFIELMDNLTHYREIYNGLGYKLIDNVDYFYLNDLNSSDNDNLAVKIQILLIVIGKYVNQQGYLLNRIYPQSTGLSADDFDRMSEIENLQEILERLKIHANLKSKDLKETIKKILVDRGVMFEKPLSGNFVLADSGMDFFKRIQKYTTATTEIAS